MANCSSRTAISKERISKDEDKAMDKQVPSNGHVEPGISIRMGPVDEMDVDAPATNGAANGKRKARTSIPNGRSYKDASSSEEDDKPLVRPTVHVSSDRQLTIRRVSGDEHLSRQRLPKTTPTPNSAMCL